jgi:hypothetical protein
VQRNQEGESNAKDNQWNQEVTVGENGPDSFSGFHLRPAGERMYQLGPT